MMFLVVEMLSLPVEVYVASDTARLEEGLVRIYRYHSYSLV